MMPFDMFLSRCSKVIHLSKPRRQFSRSARFTCTGHNDKRPSADADECADGRLLLVCRAGCSIHEIVAGAGLELHDLYVPCPKTFDDRARAPRFRASADATLRTIDNEIQEAATLIAVAGQVPLADHHRERLVQAAGVVRAARRSWEAGR